MKIYVNGDSREIVATRLSNALQELGYGEAVIATALNGRFIPHTARNAAPLSEGDRLEIVAPLQGG